jgi:hypothetical protein
MVTIATKLPTIGNNGNEEGLDCLWTIATKLFTLGNHDKYGIQVVYFRAKMT